MGRLSPLAVSLEGNIGTGKSTFLRLLKQTLSHSSSLSSHFIEEPVSDWQSIPSLDG